MSLVERAEEVARQAYAPYSQYRVGAVVHTNDGKEFVGANVENAAYPLTQCAEKNAIAAALAFAGWMAATYVLGDTRHRFLVSTLTFIMALLVAQTRVESGVHSALEVAYGGVLGALITLVVFQVLA